MNPFDILGAVVQSGMSPSSGNRMGGVLEQMMGSVLGGGASSGMSGGPVSGMPGGMQGGTPGGGIFDALSKVAGSMLGSGQGGAPGTGGGFPTEILKQVAGAVLGGNAPSGSAAAGAGSLAIFGTLAAQALAMAKSMMGSGQAPTAAPNVAAAPNIGMDDLTAVIAGMRPPQTPQEQQQLTDVATLTLQAMLNAAKADGRLDDKEQERLLGKIQEGGVSAEEQRFVAAEMQKPIDIDALVRAVPNQQVAAQIYAASLMAIEVDTDGERRYLTDLAAKLKLDPNAVAFLHMSMGIA